MSDEGTRTAGPIRPRAVTFVGRFLFTISLALLFAIIVRETFYELSPRARMIFDQSAYDAFQVVMAITLGLSCGLLGWGILRGEPWGRRGYAIFIPAFSLLAVAVRLSWDVNYISLVMYMLIVVLLYGPASSPYFDRKAQSVSPDGGTSPAGTGTGLSRSQEDAAAADELVDGRVGLSPKRIVLNVARVFVWGVWCLLLVRVLASVWMIVGVMGFEPMYELTLVDTLSFAVLVVAMAAVAWASVRIREHLLAAPVRESGPLLQSEAGWRLVWVSLLNIGFAYVVGQWGHAFAVTLEHPWPAYLLGLLSLLLFVYHVPHLREEEREERGEEGTGDAM